ncbi:MAG: phosphotransferase [Anaerolineales bacterium]|jgi:Ser/Thr protein kinase RdoA (MazF antagonist)|nr:phosphotransferase [Anaerolineales bacterium]
MMKLRHLFHNPDLAHMLVNNWNFDADSLDLFQHFRISANAVYPFRIHGEVCFLRFCPTSEKAKEQILAELEFIQYLRSNQYPALEPVPAKSGEYLVQKDTPWGGYSASVFKRVQGKQISEVGFEEEIMFAYGAALGELHALSRVYTAPQNKRWSHMEVFDWIEEVLQALPTQDPALSELSRLREACSRLPCSPDLYGLIHYDFELDNVFYDETTRTCSVIDFDDAVYHWYLMDIVQALDSLQDEMPPEELPAKQAVFLQGYRSKFPLDEALFTAMPIFRRYAGLYKYARNARSMQEQWEHEPDWMITLRQKLARFQLRQMEKFL